MWAIKNGTPYLADRTIGVDRNGAKQWVVVVKGTFDIRADGSTAPADEQVPIALLPEYSGEDGFSSLRYEQDLLPAKPRTDVYLNAFAHAPGGRPTTRTTVGLGTPRGSKTLVVHGDRRWERDVVGGIATTPPMPFLKLPIVYERAWGGYDRTDPDPKEHRLDPRNTVGTGVFSRAAHRIGKLLPNLEPNGGTAESGPVGFGALCSFWKPRSDYQGTYDAAWLERRKPLLPEDYDPQFLQCAPVDQQFGPHLVGGEPFALTGMTPSGTLRFDLPKHYFAFATHIGSKRIEHRAQMSTVVIEPEFPRVLVTWQTTLACHRDIDDIDFTSIVEKPYI
jgi:hypothetical protein